MHHYLENEEQLLDEEFRREVIEEIEGEENRFRKRRSQRAHEVYHGKSKKWVINSLDNEGLSQETVSMMRNRASNIPIMRKVTSKRAKSYAGGVTRIVEDEQSINAINQLSDEMDINTKMDTSDKYSFFAKNTAVQIVPKLSMMDADGRPRFRIASRNLPSYAYDVIPSKNDRTQAAAFILSDFVDDKYVNKQRVLDTGDTGREGANRVERNYSEGDDFEQTIADNPRDYGKEYRSYIWWSNKYHFTTDADGKYISADDKSSENVQGLNPIGMIPIITIAEDQAYSYWVWSGDDLVWGDILINKLATDMHTIAYVQGWGQLVIRGENLPKTIAGGPNKAILLDQKAGESADVFFATSNPPLSDWMAMIEQNTALYLSANGLSPRNIAAKLDASNMASGIAMLIEQSESFDSLRDKQRIFQDAEPIMWEAIRRWQNLYFEKQLLVEDFTEIGPFEDSNVKLKFHDIRPVVTEKEHVEVLKARKDLGINSQAELIMMDNPDLTPEEAEEKAAEIDAKKKERLSSFGLNNQSTDDKQEDNKKKVSASVEVSKVGPPADKVKDAIIVEEEKE